MIFETAEIDRAQKIKDLEEKNVVLSSIKGFVTQAKFFMDEVDQISEEMARNDYTTFDKVRQRTEEKGENLRRG